MQKRSNLRFHFLFVLINLGLILKPLIDLCERTPQYLAKYKMLLLLQVPKDGPSMGVRAPRWISSARRGQPSTWSEPTLAVSPFPFATKGATQPGQPTASSRQLYEFLKSGK